MIGGDQSQQFLQLRLLNHLIEIDLRKLDSKLQLLPNDETTIRHKYLQGISLSKKQGRVQLSSEIRYASKFQRSRLIFRLLTWLIQFHSHSWTSQMIGKLLSCFVSQILDISIYLSLYLSESFLCVCDVARQGYL